MGHRLLLPIILPLRRFEIGELIRLGSRLRVFFSCLEQSLLRPISSRISSLLVTLVKDWSRAWDRKIGYDELCKNKPSESNGHTTQLHGIANTLRMGTVISLGQWQPWTAVSPYREIVRCDHCFQMVFDTQGLPCSLTRRLCHADNPQKGQNTCPWLPLLEWYGCAHA